MGRVTTSATTMHSFNLICSMSTAAHAAKVIFNDRLIRGRYILCKSVPQTERSFLGDCLADTGQESQTDIVSSCPMVGIFSSYLSTCIQCASSVSIISTASTSIRMISTSAVLSMPVLCPLVGIFSTCITYPADPYTLLLFYSLLKFYSFFMRKRCFSGIFFASL